jgi:succinate-semialdehyde dehydrogenase/glutarate-semialdehyde dehydrogenase
MSQPAAVARAAAAVVDAPPPSPSPAPTEFAVSNPATGETIARVPIHDDAAVRAIVGRARAAQVPWGALSVGERCARLRPFLTRLMDEGPSLVDLLVREGGKSVADATAEASFIVLPARYYLRHGPRVLKPTRVRMSMFKNLGGHVAWHPRGVAGIISPWNYPFLIPAYELFGALVAGNAAVVKPSEWTPLVMLRTKEIWDRSGAPSDLLQVVTGLGPTGSALIDSGVDLIHFTGSVAVGRRVAAACGERLVPCVLELGGKAPAIIAPGADLDQAASSLVWGAFFNSGQTCIATERVYAVGDTAAPLVEKMAAITARIRVGNPADPDVEMGAMVMPRQVDTVAQQVEDARSKGARIVTGGVRPEGPGRFYPPTLIADANHTMAVMREETFGPAVAVMPVPTVDEAVRLANDSHLGLNAYVFAGSNAEGRRIAARVRAGSVVVNDTLYNYGLGEAPFGGVKASGIGRSHGEEGLRHYCEGRLVMYNRLGFFPFTKLFHYPYSQARTGQMRRLMAWLARR